MVFSIHAKLDLIFYHYDCLFLAPIGALYIEYIVFGVHCGGHFTVAISLIDSLLAEQGDQSLLKGWLGWYGTSQSHLAYCNF